MEYSVVIATLDRTERLLAAISSLCRQTVPPALVVVVDASDNPEPNRLALAAQPFPFAIHHLVVEQRSAAEQRNQGIQTTHTSLVAVIDDDVVLEPTVFELLVSTIKQGVAAVSARERGTGHRVPSSLLRFYYRLQAGYDDATFGTRLFGPGINCLPCYEKQTGLLLEAEWLPSTCLLLRRDAFEAAGGFPTFKEYSFMEDVWLTASIRKSGRKLLFHTAAWFDHDSQSSGFKKQPFRLAVMRMKHRRRLSREVLEMTPWECEGKLLLQKGFDAIYIARCRRQGWVQELAGTLVG